ncbi:hypothetical protein [Brachybacterium sp. FME24]|uniref:hypothetical protein n=1 Tax=Brachybacterium sp. FME24 TaxID=2742605 RepID=UPI001868F33F|nr:hypothetical protein [Brachybacterium sp. FME24]
MTPHSESEPDTAEAARRLLHAAGGSELPRLPWQHPAEPADDMTLLRYALWRANQRIDAASTEELRAALRLIESARSDLDTLEVALLLTARAEGLTWSQIAEELGLRSPQAAQQRYQRVAQRPTSEAPADPGDS